MGKLKSILFGSLLAGSLIISAGPALARWEWSDVPALRAEIRNDREKLRMDDEELARNRRLLQWDIDRGASSYQIARAQRAVDTTLASISRDQEKLQQDQRELRELLDYLYDRG